MCVCVYVVVVNLKCKEMKRKIVTNCFSLKNEENGKSNWLPKSLSRAVIEARQTFSQPASQVSQSVGWKCCCFLPFSVLFLFCACFVVLQRNISTISFEIGLKEKALPLEQHIQIHYYGFGVLAQILHLAGM